MLQDWRNMECNSAGEKTQPHGVILVWICRTCEVLGKIGAVCAGISLVVMTVVVAAGAIARYFFSVSWRFTEELSGAMLLYVFVLGWLYCLNLDKHIRVSVISNLLPKKVQSYLLVTNSLLATAYGGFLIGKGMWLVNDLLKYNVKYMTMPIPEFIGALAIPVSGGLLSFGCIALLLRQLFLFSKPYTSMGKQ